MNKKIVWKMPDGTVRVTTGSPKYKDKDIEKVAARTLEADQTLKDAIRCPDCLPEDLPSREFRHKWRHDGIKIFVDNSVADLPVPPVPRDLAAEIDELKLLLNK